MTLVPLFPPSPNSPPSPSSPGITFQLLSESQVQASGSVLGGAHPRRRVTAGPDSSPDSGALSPEIPDQPLFSVLPTLAAPPLGSIS